MSGATKSSHRKDRQRLFCGRSLNKQRQRHLNKELKKELAAKDMSAPERPTPPNRKQSWPSIEDEQAERQEKTDQYLQAFNRHLPVLLKRLSKIRDFRNTKRTKYSISVLLITGLFLFLLQKKSRREANRELTSASILESMKCLFPEFESIPHQDSVQRLLKQINVQELEDVHSGLLKHLIRKRRFQLEMINGRYTVAVDGTQKASRKEPWAEECLARKIGSVTSYYCYVVEANFAFGNGLIVPIMTEVCELYEGQDDKQDCEYRAFQRLAQRLKKTFPRLKLMIVLDGLFATGPIITMLDAYKWDWMIILKDASLSSVWQEANSLRQFHDSESNPERYRKKRTWANRSQAFWWVNQIEYEYKHERKDGKKVTRRRIIHLVVCEEEWDIIELDTLTRGLKKQRFAWISAAPITHQNVHQRCNLAARYRWTIEESFLVEKKRGYQYEHIFSTNWNAMIGYHLLMRLAHMINVLIFHTLHIAEYVALYGQMPFIRFIERTLSGNWLNLERTKEKLKQPYQIRNI